MSRSLFVKRCELNHLLVGDLFYHLERRVICELLSLDSKKAFYKILNSELSFYCSSNLSVLVTKSIYKKIAL